MLTYAYDGTFEGLLTAVHEAYYRREDPDRIDPACHLQQSIGGEVRTVPTDAAKALKVRNAVENKISPEALQNVYYVFLSELPESGRWILEYLRFGFKTGRPVDGHLTDDRVLRIVNTVQRVTYEAHKLSGLARFEQISDDTYYSPLSPDFNILVLLAPHFAARLSDQYWVLHDQKRHLAAVYDKKDWKLLHDVSDPHLHATQAEKVYREYWRSYFRQIAIPSRINPSLQRQHMPARYWKHLTEKQGGIP